MKYNPLKEYLLGLPKDKSEVTIPFAEIERIIGSKLPKSAFTYVEWWANQEYGSQAPAWLDAKFIVDNIDLARKIVSFRRAEKPRRIRSSSGSSFRSKAVSRVEPAPLVSEEFLTSAGFQKTGEWSLVSGNLILGGDIPKQAGVYAYVVDGYIRYIGLASRNLRQRLYFYQKPGKSQETNKRLHPLIKQCLEDGSAVSVLTACPGPTEWNGLPVDLSPGLESGLLNIINPPWNKSGVRKSR